MPIEGKAQVQPFTAKDSIVRKVELGNPEAHFKGAVAVSMGSETGLRIHSPEYRTTLFVWASFPSQKMAGFQVPAFHFGAIPSDLIKTGILVFGLHTSRSMLPGGFQAEQHVSNRFGPITVPGFPSI